MRDTGETMREAMRACDGGGVICDVRDMALALLRDSTLAMNMTAVRRSGEHTGFGAGAPASSAFTSSVRRPS